ncbi:unnamed protein product [Cochlearia groenlandica]
MALSQEALDDLKKIIAAQVAEVMAQSLPQQILQHLTVEREKDAKEVTSESESEHTPTPSEAMRIAKGKGLAGTSKFRVVRNLHLVHTDRDPRRPTCANPTGQEARVPRSRAHGHPRRRIDTIACQRIYIDSNDEYYGHNASDHSRRRYRRD